MKFVFTDYLLILLLIMSVYFDITKRKIPNKITVPAITVGLIFSTINSGFNGFLFSVLGFSLGLAVFFIPFTMGGIGAGDVKLMGAIGAVMGWRFILLTTVYTAIIGGVIALVVMIVKRGFRSVLGLVIKPISKFLYMASGLKKFYRIYEYFDKIKIEKKEAYIPYAIPIALGSFIVMFGARLN